MAEQQLVHKGLSESIIGAAMTVPDLIVDDRVIADPVVTSFIHTHMAQMIGYLNITGLHLALLLNFKNAKLDWKRVVR